MTGFYPSFANKVSGGTPRIPSPPDPLTRLGCIQAHGLQVSDTKILDGMNEAEANMPSLVARITRPIRIDNSLTSNFWEFLYRCWEKPNGTMRSYYIENTGEYFQRHGLKPNDKIMIYQDETHKLDASASSQADIKAVNLQPVKLTRFKTPRGASPRTSNAFNPPFYLSPSIL